MIAFIKGTVASITGDAIVVEQNGIGWRIAFAHPESVHLQEAVTIYTYMHYTDAELALYGFPDADEKELFMRLISVKGLGPKTVMNMLGRSGSSSIVQAIEAGDVAVLKKLPGIGAKTASQIVLDLQGKLVPANHTVISAKSAYPPAIEEALEGLKNLGYRSGELSGCANYLATLPDKTSAEYLKLGLQYLMRR